MNSHKNKTLAALLCFLLGAAGLHRFYLRGFGDLWGWVHFASLPASAALVTRYPELPLLLTASPLVLSALAAMSLVLIWSQPGASTPKMHCSLAI
jgi:hypothetical protein